MKRIVLCILLCGGSVISMDQLINKITVKKLQDFIVPCLSSLIETPVYVQKPNTLSWDYLCLVPELTHEYIKRIKNGHYIIIRPTEDPKDTKITSLVITGKD